MKELVRFDSVFVCILCEERLTENQRVYGNGCCAHCGNISNHTICDTKQKPVKVFRLSPWWMFWKDSFGWEICEPINKHT